LTGGLAESAGDGLGLSGIRVLDLAGTLGAYCTRLLADAGADVVKVEPPDGDELRRRPPFLRGEPDRERSLSFAYYHANKRGVVVDVAQPEGLRVLEELGASCDVAVLSPTPRRPVAGFDPDRGQLSWAAPETVVCVITPFGLTGPYRNWRATQFTSAALSGVMYAQGPEPGPPVVIPGLQLYAHVGTNAAIAILAALRARPSAGGQLIDISAHEVLSASYFDLYEYTSAQAINRRREVTGIAGGRLPCRDGMVEFGAATAKQWWGLVELLGRPEALLDPALTHPWVQAQRADALMQVITPIVAAMSQEQFIERGQELGVPCTPVNTIGDFTRDSQPRSRGFFVPLRSQVIGTVEAPGAPFRSTHPVLALYRRPAPLLAGDDAADIALQWRTARPAPPASAALAGIRVISFGTAIAGAWSGTVLADLGADVVKLEGPERPDNLRRFPPRGWPPVHEPSGADTSVMFAYFNRSTRSLALDMKDPALVELFLRLVGVCDVIVENFGPGVMDRWGVGYDQLVAANPRIILLSLSGFGHAAGPRSHSLAYGSTVATFSGLTQAWRYVNGTHFDYVSEALGVFGVLAALAARDRTGLGTHLDLAEVEAAACVMGELMLDFLANGRDSQPVGNRVPGSVLSEVVACLGDDQWLAVELEDAGDWDRLAELLDRADLRDATMPPGESARAEMTASLARWARPLTVQQAARQLQRLGLAAGPVQNVEDVTLDPQHRERRFFYEMHHPDLGTGEYPAPVHHLAKTPPRVSRRTPRLGEHNVEVLTEWLGMSEAEAARFAWPNPAFIKD
jgi:crotonobetainyl-CoA:carnitine CoA-transferase CaiB-like acyl-CoA transferase